MLCIILNIYFQSPEDIIYSSDFLQQFLLWTGQFSTNIFTFGPARVRRKASPTDGFRQNITLLSSLGLDISIRRPYNWSLSFWSSSSGILFPLHGWPWRVILKISSTLSSLFSVGHYPFCVLLQTKCWSGCVVRCTKP